MHKIIQMMSDVYLIEDQAKYYSTLVVGKNKALLWDTGCGLDDLKETIQSLTKLPVLVICSHTHFDHIGGSIQFDEVFIHPEERINLEEYTDEKLSMWLTEMNPEHRRIEYHSNQWNHLKNLNFKTFDLGNLKCEIIEVPGHSISEIVVHIPSKRLILSGDCLLPMMTLMFKHHGNVELYKKSLQRIYSIDFDYYLTSHLNHILPKEKIRTMITCLEECKGKKFHKYRYPYPPYGDGYFHLYSLEEDPVGLIVESMADI